MFSPRTIISLAKVGHGALLPHPKKRTSGLMISSYGTNAFPSQTSPSVVRSLLIPSGYGREPLQIMEGKPRSGSQGRGSLVPGFGGNHHVWFLWRQYSFSLVSYYVNQQSHSGYNKLTPSQHTHRQRNPTVRVGAGPDELSAHVPPPKSLFLL